MNAPYFPFYIGDYLSDKYVLLMSWDQKGMHTHFLCIAWQEDPPGTLPDNDSMLSRWVNVSEKEWHKLKPGIFRGWKRDGLRLIHEGLCRAHEKTKTFSESQQKKAVARWGSSKMNDAGALPRECSSSSNLNKEIKTQACSVPTLNEHVQGIQSKEKEIGLQNTADSPSQTKTSLPTLPSPASPLTVDDLFALFWKRWPNKVHKQQARAVFHTTVTGMDYLNRMFTILAEDLQKGWVKENQLPENWLRNYIVNKRWRGGEY